MKKKLSLILAIIMAFNVNFSSAIGFGKTQAKIIEIKGNVKIQKENAKNNIKAFVKMNLSKGDTIITENNSSVKLLFNKNTVLNLSANSNVKLEEVINTSTKKENILKVKKGKVLSTVNKKLEPQDKYTIKTPTMIAGVRGTEFLVEVNDDEDFDLKVFDGTVSINTVEDEDNSNVKLIKNGNEITINKNTIEEDLKKEPEEINVDNLDEEILNRVKEIAVEKPDSISDSLYEKVDKKLQSINKNKNIKEEDKKKQNMQKRFASNSSFDVVTTKNEVNVNNYQGYKKNGFTNYKDLNVHNTIESAASNKVDLNQNVLEFVENKINKIGLKSEEKQNLLNNKKNIIKSKKELYKNQKNFNNYIDKSYLDSVGLGHIDSKELDVNDFKNFSDNNKKANINLTENSDGSKTKTIIKPNGMVITIKYDNDGNQISKDVDKSNASFEGHYFGEKGGVSSYEDHFHKGDDSSYNNHNNYNHHNNRGNKNYGKKYR